MATDKPRVAAYISQPIYEALEKFCFANNLIQKDRKTNEDRPNLSKAVELLLDRALAVGNTLKPTSGLLAGNIPQLTDSTLIESKIREQISLALSEHALTQKEAFAHITQRLSLIEDNLEKIESLNNTNQLLKQKVEELEERVSNLHSSLPVGHSGKLSSIPVDQVSASNDIPVTDSNPLASTALTEASLPESTSARHSNLPSSTLVDISHIPTSTPVDQQRLPARSPDSQPSSITGGASNLLSDTPLTPEQKPDDSLSSVPSNTPFQRSDKSPKKAKKKKEVSPDLQKAAEVTQALSKPIANEPHQEEETAFGITNAELARRLGVDKSAVSRWKSGSTSPGDPKVRTEFARWEFKGGAWYRKNQ